MIIPRIWLCLLSLLIHILSVASWTNKDDVAALYSLKSEWENIPPNWDGSDPCGDHWVGIQCINSLVTSITLSSINLNGQLSGDIAGLSELETLDLSYNKNLTGPLPPVIENLKKLSILSLLGCGFSGPIPDTIGSLRKLQFLALNSNRFIGVIPPSIGKLSKLKWLDLADNKLYGTIPVSSGSTPGLDMLLDTEHFHFEKNQLSGDIPAQLFSPNMKLRHLLLQQNKFTGNIPETLGLVKSLEVVRLDRNLLNGSVPSILNNLTNVHELYLSNNGLGGALPNLTGMHALYSLDMSNNTFDPTGFSLSLLTLISLATLVMENTGLQGQVPAALFDLNQLQNVNLSKNKLSGTLTISSSYSSQLQLIDMGYNFIDSFTERPGIPFQIILVNNTFCEKGGNANYCVIPQPESPYSTPANCSPHQCLPFQISSPKCACAYPYMGNLFFRAPSFSNLANSSIYITLNVSLMDTFQSHKLPVDAVSLTDPQKNLDDVLVIHLEVFPVGQDYFNWTGISGIGFVLSNQIFKPPKEYGPFYFNADEYWYFSESSKPLSTGIIVGAVVGGSVLLILSLVVGVYAFRQKRRALEAAKKSDPFASWDSAKNSGGVPQLKGAKCFSFEELKKCTNKFSETNEIGSGGYGKVYRGSLPCGQLVAIKRAVQGSIQGAPEFKSEIELLSRVHHKNVVALVGFCFEQGEQMLVYEYIPNGTLKGSLSGKSGIRLDWKRRLQIALGSARGLHYLHDLVNPPIIHRDIKTNNILLDEHLTAKISDFGLSKSMDDPRRGHVTTQVKGTIGYMDPEYYMTNQLTEKSDVYSFGVVLLELLTARTPTEKGKYIVLEVKRAIDRSKEMYNLHAILDPAICSSITPKSVEKYVDLAFRCVEESGVHRPTMSEVVKEIEDVMEMIGVNPNSESASTSESYEVAVTGFEHPYSDQSPFIYSETYPPSKLEPK